MVKSCLQALFLFLYGNYNDLYRLSDSFIRMACNVVQEVQGDNMTKQLSADTRGMIPSVAVLNMQVKEMNDHDAVYDAADTVAYEQVGLGDYWGTEDAPRQPVVFVGFPRNFRSRADHAGEIQVKPGETVAVRYEQSLGESVPYEEMGLSRFL